MNFRVRALASKDLSLFFRNRFYALITGLGLVTFIVLYFVMPSSVDENLDIAVYGEVIPPAFENIGSAPGFNLDRLESSQALKEAVLAGQYDAGMELPPDILEKLAQGARPEINLYFPANRPPEVRDAVVAVIKNLAFTQTGSQSVEISTQVLGPDLLGAQIPLRDRMRPLLAVMIIMFEILGLANLITDEVEQGTARALLVTPMKVTEFFGAKALMGIGLAFAQAVVFMAIVGGFTTEPLLILVALFLGAILVTGTGFLVASVSRDMMSVMAWGVLAVIIFTIPSFNILFPGSGSDWARIIPAYYLSNVVNQVSNYGTGWSSLAPDLAILAAFDAAILSGGVVALRRKLKWI